MDDQAYLITTYGISIAALIAFLLDATTRIATKRALEFKDYVVYVLFFAGIYLMVPCTMYLIGKKSENIELLKKTAVISINNFEKRLCYQIIADNCYNGTKKDGKNAIKYYEKAIAGDYPKYSKNSKALAYLYLLKGDTEKVLQIEKDLNTKEVTPYAYILKGDYKKALETFPNELDAEHFYLKAALLASTGKQRDAALYRSDALSAYNRKLKEIDDKFAKNEYTKNVASYKSIPSFIAKLARDKKEYNL